MKASEDCIISLHKNGYKDILNTLSKILSGELWITGGWIRNSALEKEYYGDIDCITPIKPHYLRKNLNKIGLCYQVNSFGSLRVNLDDGNHIDISSTFSHSNTSNILDALNKFNFSVNAAALNWSSEEVLTSKHFENDIKNKKFRILEKKSFSGHIEIDVLKDISILEGYYKLAPIKTSQYKKLKIITQHLSAYYECISIDQGLLTASEKLTNILGTKHQIWIVRGHLRCLLLNELNYWDDIDAIVDCSIKQLRTQLNRSGVKWINNYFGNPKVILPSGASIDIWCLDKNESIHQAISKFEHNLDACAWSVKDKVLIADEQVIHDFTNKILRVNLQIINEMSKYSASYMAIKSLYLIIRHNLKFDQSVELLLNKELEKSAGMKKHALSLIKELHIVRVQDKVGAIKKIRKVISTDNELISMMLNNA